MEKVKKIASIALSVFIVLLFVASAILVIANLSVDRKKGETPNLFGYVMNSVQSNSMKGTFSKGALVIGKLVKDDTVIEKDDIITFSQKVDGGYIFNTHRVVATDEIGGATIYQTQGDNRDDGPDRCPAPDEEWKTIHQIQSVYCFHIPLLGGIIDFLKTPLGFILCLVVPMLAFIGYQVYKLIALYLQSKKEEMLEQAKEGVSDEAKDAIIREYLAKMQAQGAVAPEAPAEAAPEAEAPAAPTEENK